MMTPSPAKAFSLSKARFRSVSPILAALRVSRRKWKERS